MVYCIYVSSLLIYCYPIFISSETTRCSFGLVEDVVSHIICGCCPVDILKLSFIKFLIYRVGQKSKLLYCGL